MSSCELRSDLDLAFWFGEPTSGHDLTPMAGRRRRPGHSRPGGGAAAGERAVPSPERAGKTISVDQGLGGSAS